MDTAGVHKQLDTPLGSGPPAHPAQAHRKPRVCCIFFLRYPGRYGQSKACNGIGFDSFFRFKEHLDRVHGPKTVSPTKKSANQSTVGMLTEGQLRLIAEAGQSEKHHGLGSQVRAAWSIIFPNKSVPPPFKLTVDQLMTSLHECPLELHALTRQRAAAAWNTENPGDLVRGVMEDWVHLLRENGGFSTGSNGIANLTEQQLVLQNGYGDTHASRPPSLYVSPLSYSFGEAGPGGRNEEVSSHFDDGAWQRAEDDIADEEDDIADVGHSPNS